MSTRRPAAQQLAFVLHRYDWSETSLILDLFTREAGRVPVVAKGAKRPYSQLRSVLLPFQRLQVSYGSRRSSEDESAEVQPLRSAEWAGGGAMPSGAALLTGFYLNELLMKLLPRHDPHPALFDAYALTLESLVAGEDVTVQAALRAFELVLLREIGLLPDLGVVSSTQQGLSEGQRYTLRPEQGVAPAGASEPGLPGEALVVLRDALASSQLGALQAAALPVLPELKSMLRNLLHYHLGSPILRTRQLMMELQQP